MGFPDRAWLLLSCAQVSGSLYTIYPIEAFGVGGEDQTLLAGARKLARNNCWVATLTMRRNWPGTPRCWPEKEN